jgi:hypothetical protein
MPMDATTMATMRRYIAEPDTTTYSDAALDAIYDANGGDVNLAAAEVWTEKASAAATLVDMSEGDSSRKNSQVHAQALKQSELFRGSASTTTAAATRSARTRAIERP